MKLLFFALTLISSSAFASSSQELVCKNYLNQNAVDEATILVGDGFFPADVTEQIDFSKQASCTTSLVSGTFEILDPTSEVCAAKASYNYECKFAKKSGGFISEKISGDGTGCCPISEERRPLRY